MGTGTVQPAPPSMLIPSRPKLLCVLLALFALAPISMAQDKLKLNTSEWEVLVDLQLKHNQITGLEARNKSGSYRMEEGKLKPGAANADLKGMRRYGRKWLYEDPRTSTTQLVHQELYVGVLCGNEEGWGKEKSLGDGLRVQNLCAALLERDSFGLFLPTPGKKLKWAKLSAFRGVEFTFEGPWRKSKTSRGEAPFLAHGWAVDCPGDDLLILFYGPDSREVSYKDALKVIRKMVVKVKPMTARDMAKYEKEMIEAARGNMRKRKWSTPFHSVSLKAWPEHHTLSTDLKEALNEGMTWLIKSQVESHWPGEKANAKNKVGIAALAGRAIMGAHSIVHHPQAEAVVAKTETWILSQQSKVGLIGAGTGNSTPYNHAIATAFLLDRYEAAGLPEGELRDHVQKALDFIQSSQDKGGGWDYDTDGRESWKCDPSVTFWNIVALIRGMECGFSIKDECFIEARNAMLSMTGPNGKVGYSDPGGDVARTASAGKKFPWSKSEALTGIGLYCTLLVDTLVLTASEPSAIQWNATRRCLESAPSMDPEALDLYYWQAASCGLTLMGGAEAKEWRKALNRALLQWRISDKKDPNFGAWTEDTAWGEEGGHALTTSLAMLSLLNANAAPGPRAWSQEESE
jgi:hypothetical protein